MANPTFEAEMKYLDEYRDAAAARQYALEIGRVTLRPWKIMEVCGGQTHAIVKFGIDELRPKTSRSFTVLAARFASRPWR